MGRVDLKIQEVLRHIDNRFDTLYDALFSQQHQLVSQVYGPISEPSSQAQAPEADRKRAPVCRSEV